jgi:hypothetical protein
LQPKFSESISFHRSEPPQLDSRSPRRLTLLR